MEFKYKTEFSSPIKTVFANEQGKYVSLASLKEIAALAPESAIVEGNRDLLYNVFNAAVVNRVNKNEDGLLAETAQQIYKKFVHKPMNIEHDRSMVVGHIIDAGFSEYKTNKIITDSVSDLKEPFYLTLSAVAYKLCDPGLCQLLVESSDETSAQYNAISTSWELGFNDYYILLGHKDVTEGELITDKTQIEAFSKYLKCNGGRGALDDGRPVYRIIAGEVQPLGCGYTTTPAADVSGVLVIPDLQASKHITEDDKEDDEDEAGAGSGTTPEPESLTIEVEPSDVVAEIISTENNLENQNNYSQEQTNNVKLTSIMKLTDIDNITDENIQQFSAANIKNFFADKIEEATLDYGAKLDLAKADLAKKENEAESIAKQLEESKNLLKALQEELNATKEAKAAEKAQADFNLRMADLNEKYNLSVKDSEVIAKAISGLNDESYAAWYSDFATIAEFKSKSYKPEAQAQASIEDVLDKKEQDAVATPPTVEDLKAKMAAAWDVKDIVRIKR